jgi:hypothetical protein
MPNRHLPKAKPPFPPGLSPEDWPYVERPIMVPHYASRRWAGKVADELTVDGRIEWPWFMLIQPSNPRRFLDGNGSKGEAGEQAYVRFGEDMAARNPIGVKQARHVLARYLEALKAYLMHSAGVGPTPDPYGPPIGLTRDRPCNLLPSNRHPILGLPDNNATFKQRRRGYDAARSVRIRMDAVLMGKDPEKAAAAEIAKSRRAALARAKGNKPLGSKG